MEYTLNWAWLHKLSQMVMWIFITRQLIACVLSSFRESSESSVVLWNMMKGYCGTPFYCCLTPLINSPGWVKLIKYGHQCMLCIFSWVHATFSHTLMCDLKKINLSFVMFVFVAVWCLPEICQGACRPWPDGAGIPGIFTQASTGSWNWLFRLTNSCFIECKIFMHTTLCNSSGYEKKWFF